MKDIKVIELSSLENVKRLVLRSVKPSDEERDRVRSAVDEISARLEREGLRFELGGSYARDTWISGSYDVDFFVLYDPSLGDEGISRKGIEDLTRAVKGLNYWFRYAEHPYIEGELNGVKFNLVPCADTEKGKWVTSMDRSRYHTLYLSSVLDERLRDEVRVLKAFLRANSLYGAEIRVGGFSGYATEVLTVRYGSFEGVLKAATEWREGEAIYIEKPSYEPASRHSTPIILLDPVDENRNLASAIRPQNIAKLIVLSALFLEKPSIKFFEKRTVEPPDDAIRAGLAVCIKAPLQKVEEIRWSEYYKSANALVKLLELNGFSPARYSVAESDGWASMVILTPFSERLTEVKAGPPVWLAKNALSFIRENKNVWLGNDMRVYALKPRSLRDPVSVIKNALADPVAIGVARGLEQEFKAALVLSAHEALNSPCKGAFKEALSSVFEPLWDE